jgi:hypothetical protein
MNHERIVPFLLHILKKELSIILYKQNNIIESFFYGRTKIQFSCNRCHTHENNYYQSFAIKHCDFEKTWSIENLFRNNYLEKWYCKYCESPCANIVKTYIILPQFLIIQLKQNQWLNNQTNIQMNINIETHETYFLKCVLKSKRSYKKVFMDYLLFILNFSDNQSINGDGKCKN